MDQQQLSFTGVYVKNSIDFIETVFSCYSSGETVVLIGADGSAQECFDLSRVVEPDLITGWAKLSFSSRSSDDIAQVSFTSGTEGKPKGVAITHNNLSDTVMRLNGVMDMDVSIREYVGIPVYHSFGFGRCRAIATLGGEFYIPPLGFNPLEIKDMLDKGEINAISAVPSLWRTLLECKDIFGEEVQAIKWIEIGSQYMSADEKRDLKVLFPNACIVQHYGLTEASRATFLNIQKCNSDYLLGSVGGVVGDTEIKITAEGKIAVRGGCVAKKRYVGGVLEEMTDSSGWLVTSDLGFIEDGFLFFGGRADDQINCGGVKVSPDMIENELCEKVGVERKQIACAKIPDAMRGDGVLLVYTTDINGKKDILKSVLINILAQKNINLGSGLKMMSLDQLPLTDTGKVQRKHLAEKYVSSAPEAKLACSSGSNTYSGREAELVELWKQVLNVDSVSIDESFYDLGGDSITAISAIMKMKLISVPDYVSKGILQGYTIRELVELENSAKNDGVNNLVLEYKNDATIDNNLNIKIIRGLLVLFVIFAHWSDGVIDRLPEIFQGIKPVLAPLLSFGTPGFAIMYGVAMGYSAYPVFDKTPHRFRGRLLPIILIVFVGILILGGVSLLYTSTQSALTTTIIFNHFYGVLTYYFLATATVYFWFLFLKFSGSPVLTAFITAGVFHLIYVNYMIPMADLKTEGVVEFLKLLFVGKYNYFNMSGGVFAGIGFGILLYQSKLDSFTTRQLFVPVILLVCLAMLWSIVMQDFDQWLVWPVSKVQAWRWVFYLGACCSLYLIVGKLISQSYFNSNFVRVLAEVIACIGVLAFPFFVVHGIVIPLKGLLVYVGVGETIALLVAVIGFLFGSFLMVKKVHKLHFS